MGGKVYLLVNPNNMKNLHLLESNKPSRLHLGGSGLVLCDFVFDKSTINSQHIYITSDVEITGFENNIWVIKGERIFLWQNTMALVSNNKPKKIILTTDPQLIEDDVQEIDKTFLEWFVKNPSCESVDVKDFPTTEKYNSKGEYIHNSNWIYKIIIPKEPNQSAVEEIAKTKAFEFKVDYKPFETDLDYREYAEYGFKKGFIDGTKCQAERSYSNEEVLDILDKFLTSMVKDEKTGLIEKWFEQFKKK